MPEDIGRVVVLEVCYENSKRVDVRVVGLDENSTQFDSLGELRFFLKTALDGLPGDIRKVPFSRAPRRRSGDK